MSNFIARPVAHLQAEVQAAMKSGDKNRLQTLRLLLSAARQVEIDSQKNLTFGGFVIVLEKMIKQRRDSIALYLQGGREELAKNEAAEITVLQPFLPPRLDDDEVKKIIADAVAKTGAQTMRDMGKVMAILKPKLAGKTDMAMVGKRVKSALSG